MLGYRKRGKNKPWLERECEKLKDGRQRAKVKCFTCRSNGEAQKRYKEMKKKARQVSCPKSSVREEMKVTRIESNIRRHNSTREMYHRGTHNREST